MPGTKNQGEPMSYAYRYLDENERPLRSCPLCGHDLTREGGIQIWLNDGSPHVWEVPSCLDHQGNLVDPDGQVAKGLHVGDLLWRLPGTAHQPGRGHRRGRRLRPRVGRRLGVCL